MADVIVSTIFGLFNTFCTDSLGAFVCGFCTLGVSVALFRYLRSGAGG